jgi:hypothetical protein
MPARNVAAVATAETSRRLDWGSCETFPGTHSMGKPGTDPAALPFSGRLGQHLH